MDRSSLGTVELARTTDSLRQVRTCQTALPPGCAIVAYFYDVESSRKDLDARGTGRAPFPFPSVWCPRQDSNLRHSA